MSGFMPLPKIILGWTPQGNTACQKQILPGNKTMSAFEIIEQIKNCRERTGASRSVHCGKRQFHDAPPIFRRHGRRRPAVIRAHGGTITAQLVHEIESRTRDPIAGCQPAHGRCLWENHEYTARLVPGSRAFRLCDLPGCPAWFCAPSPRIRCSSTGLTPELAFGRSPPIHRRPAP